MRAASPSTMPACMASRVFLPITLRGGRDDAADEGARIVEHLEVRRRAEIDYHHRRAVALLRRHEIGDAVGSDLARIVVLHLETRLKTRPHHERTLTADAGEHGAPCGREVGHHARENGAVDRKRVLRGVSAQRHDARERDKHLVGRRLLARRERPRGSKLIAFKQTEVRMRVAYIHREDHPMPPFPTRFRNARHGRVFEDYTVRRLFGNPTSHQGEADICEGAT